MSARRALVVLGVIALGAPASYLSAHRQETLAQAASRFAEAWMGRDLNTVASLFATEGIHVTLEGRDYHLLQRRQAIASLRTFLKTRTGAEIGVRRVSELGGTPARGFAEVAWEAVDDDSGERLRRTLFLAFVLDAGAWRVEDLRVLR